MRPRIPPPILAVLVALLMWTLDRWTPLAQWIDPPLNRLGGLVAAFGAAIAVAAFARFRKVGTTVSPLEPSKASYLVTDGVFRVSRNPMYLGLLLLLIGWAILAWERKPLGRSTVVRDRPDRSADHP